MLTNSSLLTGQVILNPNAAPVEEPFLVFLNEILDTYSFVNAKTNLSLLPVKLCVLGAPGKKGDQKMGSTEVRMIGLG